MHLRSIGAHHFKPMSIDKESSGVPEVNVHKRTTKVNLSIVVGVILFLVIMGAVVAWLAASNR